MIKGHSTVTKVFCCFFLRLIVSSSILDMLFVYDPHIRLELNILKAMIFVLIVSAKV